MTHFTGLMAAPFTPFDTQGNFNPDIVATYIDKLVDDGLKGIFVCGSNGEGPNMTTEERMMVAKAFTEAAASRLKVFVHVGHSSIKESQKLALHANKIGADAISAVSAFYFKPGSVKELVFPMAEIAKAAPELPFYYYHIPHLTGVNMNMLELFDLGAKHIPNLAGIKYTAPSLWEYQLCKNYQHGRFDVLYGQDEMMLSALAIGATGLIGSTYNFAAPLYLEVMKSMEQKNLEQAQEKMLLLVQMVNIITKINPIAAQKTVMKRLGIDLGPSRLPLSSLSTTEETRLLKQLDEIMFFEKLLAVYHSTNGD